MTRACWRYAPGRLADRPPKLTTDARDWLYADGYRVSDVDGAHPTPAQQEHLNSCGTWSIDLESNFAAKATAHSPSPAV